MRTISSEHDISAIIKKDEWMMDVLRAAEELNLPDWWIGAGFLRNKVWDYLEGNDSEPSRDVDLVYFNPDDVNPETDWAHDKRMKSRYPFAEWEVRNQARMHYVNDSQPFSSTEDGIAHWVETATSIAVRIHEGELKYLFCYGTGDLFNLIARPVPFFSTQDKRETFFARLEKKRWKDRWPNLEVMTE